jgi:hypothetical protein
MPPLKNLILEGLVMMAREEQALKARFFSLSASLLIIFLLFSVSETSAGTIKAFAKSPAQPYATGNSLLSSCKTAVAP